HFANLRTSRISPPILILERLGLTPPVGTIEDAYLEADLRRLYGAKIIHPKMAGAIERLPASAKRRLILLLAEKLDLNDVAKIPLRRYRDVAIETWGDRPLVGLARGRTTASIIHESGFITTREEMETAVENIVSGFLMMLNEDRHIF